MVLGALHPLTLLILLLLALSFNTVIISTWDEVQEGLVICPEQSSWVGELGSTPSSLPASPALRLVSYHLISLWEAYHCSPVRNEKIQSHGVPVTCLKSYPLLKSKALCPGKSDASGWNVAAAVVPSNLVPKCNLRVWVGDNSPSRWVACLLSLSHEQQLDNQFD